MEQLNALLAWVEVVLPLFLLVSLRVAVTLAAMPAPLGDVAPTQIRAALGLMIAVTICVPHQELASAIPEEPLALLRLAAGEVLIGAVIGLTVRVVIATASVAGGFIGFSSGLAFAQSVDPTLGETSTPVARGMSSLAVAIFFALNGHHAVIGALAGSVTAAPPGDVFGVVGQDGVIALGGSMIGDGLRIAAPVVATMFVVQVGMAMAAKAAPRVHVFQMTFAVAVTAGLLTLFTALPSLAPSIAAEIRALPETLNALLGA